MYDLEAKPEIDRIFRKLAKRNQKRLQIIEKKVFEIRNFPDHSYKFLTAPLQNFNRVHIMDHFVLIFKVGHQRRKVVLYYFAHHDEAYRWRPDEGTEN